MNQCILETSPYRAWLLRPASPELFFSSLFLAFSPELTNLSSLSWALSLLSSLLSPFLIKAFF